MSNLMKFDINGIEFVHHIWENCCEMQT